MKCFSQGFTLSETLTDVLHAIAEYLKCFSETESIEGLNTYNTDQTDEYKYKYKNCGSFLFVYSSELISSVN